MWIVANNLGARMFFPKAMCVLFVLMAWTPDSVAMCKWTDKNGTVHYAEKCPDVENSTRIEIEPPPTQEQIEARRRQAEQMRRASEADKPTLMEQAFYV